MNLIYKEAGKAVTLFVKRAVFESLRLLGGGAAFECLRLLGGFAV
jgi:hypothetical protein